MYGCLHKMAEFEDKKKTTVEQPSLVHDTSVTACDETDQILDIPWMLGTKELNSLIALFDRQCFSRAWAFQESVLGRNKLIVTGSFEIPDSAFEIFMVCLASGDRGPDLSEALTLLSSNLLGLIYRASFLFKYSEKYDTDPELEFWESLYCILKVRQITNVKATDPRDLTYSLLGVTTIDSNISIIPDYLVPWADLYTTTASNIIKETARLLILESGGISTLNDLPTWVPDWQEAGCQRVRGGRGVRGSSIISDDVTSSTEGHRILRVGGVSIAEVSHVSGSHIEFPCDLGSSGVGKDGEVYQATCELLGDVMGKVLSYDRYGKNVSRDTQSLKAWLSGDVVSENKLKQIDTVLGHSMLLVLNNGMLGRGSPTSLIGDQVYLLLGHDVPAFL